MAVLEVKKIGAVNGLDVDVLHEVIEQVTFVPFMLSANGTERKQ